MKRQNIDMIFTALPFVTLAGLAFLYLAIEAALVTHPGILSQPDLIEFYSKTTYLGFSCFIVIWSADRLQRIAKSENK